jgi:hypothetical protein
MTDLKFIGNCRNLQGALRQFEGDLDRLLDDFLADISEAIPGRYVEARSDDEDIRRIGGVIAIAVALIEDDLQERVDAAHEDFSWRLTRLLCQLWEMVR